MAETQEATKQRVVYPQTSIYFGPQKAELIKRYMALEDKTGVSVSALITAAMEVCVDKFEKNVPDKRKFTIDGKTIII